MENVDDIESELIIQNEGTARFYTFDSKKYSDGGKALRKSMPVFYNPIQEINRSITMVVYRAFAELNKENERLNPLTICDCMAASGIRAIRLYEFLDKNVILSVNDLNPLALRVIRKNAALNRITDEELESNFIFTHEDARFLFHKLNNERNYQGIIDIDPFGTPNVFIEPAIKAVHLNGMLGITATDTAVLFGIKKEACARKYNTTCLRSSFLKEVGLRILIYFVAIRAHPHLNYIEPQLSLSFEHYVRIFVTVHRGKKGIDDNLSNFGYFYWCPECDWRETYSLKISSHPKICPECGGRVRFGGPLWVGKLNYTPFVENVREELASTSAEIIPSKKRLEKVFEKLQFEDDFPAGYYDLHKLCDKMNLSIGKTRDLISRIENLGYHAGRTHIEAHAIKTDIPLSDLRKLLKEIDFQITGLVRE